MKAREAVKARWQERQAVLAARGERPSEDLIESIKHIQIVAAGLVKEVFPDEWGEVFMRRG